jgi:hypothetical protein
MLLQVLRFNPRPRHGPAEPEMEKRNMAKQIIDCLKHAACSASPNHGLTPLEIQRWEDDGGAVLGDAAPRPEKADRRVDNEVGEMAAAE